MVDYILKLVFKAMVLYFLNASDIIRTLSQGFFYIYCIPNNNVPTDFHLHKYIQQNQPPRILGAPPMPLWFSHYTPCEELQVCYNEILTANITNLVTFTLVLVSLTQLYLFLHNFVLGKIQVQWAHLQHGNIDSRTKYNELHNLNT